MYNWKRNGTQGLFTVEQTPWTPNSQSNSSLQPVIQSTVPQTEDLADFTFSSDRTINQGIVAYGVPLEVKHSLQTHHYEFVGTAIAHHEEGQDFPLILQPFVSFHVDPLTDDAGGNTISSARFIPANSSIGTGSTHSSCETSFMIAVKEASQNAGYHFIAGWALTYPKDGTLSVKFSGDMSFKRLGGTTIHTHDPHM